MFCALQDVFSHVTLIIHAASIYASLTLAFHSLCACLQSLLMVVTQCGWTGRWPIYALPVTSMIILCASIRSPVRYRISSLNYAQCSFMWVALVYNGGRDTKILFIRQSGSVSR